MVKCKEAKQLVSQHWLPYGFTSTIIVIAAIFRLKSHLTYA